MDIYFHFQKQVKLTDRKQLRSAIAYLFEREKKSVETVTIVFCDDDYLLQINQTYLQHDYFTDIITFDLSGTPKSAIVGEVYISVDTVRSNARDYDVPFNHELHRVIFHGLLHLCGYKDKDASEIKKMRNAESKYLKLYFPDPM